MAQQLAELLETQVDIALGDHRRDGHARRRLAQARGQRVLQAPVRQQGQQGLAAGAGRVADGARVQQRLAQRVGAVDGGPCLTLGCGDVHRRVRDRPQGAGPQAAGGRQAGHRVGGQDDEVDRLAGLDATGGIDAADRFEADLQAVRGGVGGGQLGQQHAGGHRGNAGEGGDHEWGSVGGRGRRGGGGIAADSGPAGPDDPVLASTS